VAEASACGLLLVGNGNGDGGYALPGAVNFGPGVDGAFAVNVGLTFFHAFDAEDADGDGRVAIDLDGVLFVDGLGRLEIVGLDAGEIFFFGGEGAVAFHGDYGVGEEHVESLDVFGFEGVIPGGFESEDAATIVGEAALAGEGDGYAEKKECCGEKCAFDGHKGLLAAGGKYFQERV
jgi:hypothetical protein